MEKNGLITPISGLFLIKTAMENSVSFLFFMIYGMNLDFFWFCCYTYFSSYFFIFIF